MGLRETIPEAAATAEPLLDPPGTRWVLESHGFQGVPVILLPPTPIVVILLFRGLAVGPIGVPLSVNYLTVLPGSALVKYAYQNISLCLLIQLRAAFSRT